MNYEKVAHLAAGTSAHCCALGALGACACMADLLTDVASAGQLLTTDPAALKILILAKPTLLCGATPTAVLSCKSGSSIKCQQSTGGLFYQLHSYLAEYLNQNT